jgi:hypothetical protein
MNQETRERIDQLDRDQLIEILTLFGFTGLAIIDTEDELRADLRGLINDGEIPESAI